MTWGFRRGEWHVEDSLGDRWRIFLTPISERRSGGSSGDWQGRCQLEQLVFDGFTHSGATADRIASVILEVYDALTNERLSSRLPSPIDDPARTLGGMEEELRRALVAALMADEIRIEPVVRTPWPFLDPPDNPVTALDTAPVSEEPTWIGLLLVDQTGRAVPRRAYRVVFPDGAVRDGTLDNRGAAMLSGTVPGACQVYCPYAEPHAQLTYVVQQGDHLSGIAQSFGFDDYTLVWNDPGNANLKSERSDPHVLLPGDSLEIPQLTPHPLTKGTGATHTFTIVRTPLKVRLMVLDRAAKPTTSVSVTIDGNELSIDGTGLVEAAVDKTESAVRVALPDSNFVLDIGALNPSDDTSDAGYKARLFNLGFLLDPSVDDTDDEMVIALQDFQAQYQLPLTGQLDDATKAQLTQSYGS